MIFPKSPQRVTIYCPVCQTRLGLKNKETVKSFNCRECKATYIYYPNDPLHPKAMLNKVKKNPAICGCGRCGR